MMDLLATHAPVIGLLLFFGIFMGIVVWVMRPGMKQKFEKDARIPLREDSDGE